VLCVAGSRPFRRDLPRLRQRRVTRPERLEPSQSLLGKDPADFRAAIWQYTAVHVPIKPLELHPSEEFPVVLSVVHIAPGAAL
jgi:hypothetical protein